MKTFTIVQLCCDDCRHFSGIYFVDNRPLTFISNLHNCTEYTYLIYCNGCLVDHFDGSFLGGVSNV